MKWAKTRPFFSVNFPQKKRQLDHGSYCIFWLFAKKPKRPKGHLTTFSFPKPCPFVQSAEFCLKHRQIEVHHVPGLPYKNPFIALCFFPPLPSPFSGLVTIFHIHSNVDLWLGTVECLSVWLYILDQLRYDNGNIFAHHDIEPAISWCPSLYVNRERKKITRLQTKFYRHERTTISLK